MPAYSSFVSLVGAPTALLGAGMDWTFRLNAIPGLLALAGLAAALHARERAHTLLAIMLVAGSPVAYLALDTGHPEDLLAAAAATAGVLAAVRRRATLAAVLLTVAVLAKQTAVLALLPAALALPKPKLRVLAAPVDRALAVYGGIQLLRPAGAHTAAPPARSSTRGRSGGRSASRPARSGPRPATANHLARLAGADPAPADRPARTPAQPRLVVARRTRSPREDALALSRCSRSSAACSTRGTSAITTCR